jgi:hypothetical protein
MVYPFRIHKQRKKIVCQVSNVKRPMNTYEIEIWDIVNSGSRVLVGVGTIDAPAEMWAAGAVHNGDIVIVRGSQLGECDKKLRSMIRSNPHFLARNPTCTFGVIEAEFFEEEKAYVKDHSEA